MNDSVSQFEASTFLGATFTEANTRRPPIPGGTRLIGTLSEAKTRKVTINKEGERKGEEMVWCDIPISFDLTQNPSVLQHCFGSEATEGTVTLTHSFALDLTPKGLLDMSSGRNNGLRRLREALDLNKPNENFSMPMIIGRQVQATINNRPYEGEVYDGIASLAKLG